MFYNGCKFVVVHQVSSSAASVALPASRSRLASAAVAAPLADLHARADEAAALLKALANPDRLLLMCRLVEGESSVSDLGLATGIGQPSLSQQLAVLRAEHLVGTRRDGQRVVYRITSAPALAMLRTLHSLFCPPDSNLWQDPA